MAQLFRRILVPHDLSATATRALELAVELAEEHGGRVTALHVLTPFYSGPGYPTQTEIAWTPPAQLVRDRQVQLERLVRAAVGDRANVVTCRAVMGEALPSILAAARRADVIVMSTLGRTGLPHLLIGSVAEKIVRHSPIPVLTVRAPRRRRRVRPKGKGNARRR